MRDETRSRKQLIGELESLREELARLRDIDLAAARLKCAEHLASGLAHNFNNILTPILGYAQLGISNYPDDRNLTKYLDEISKAADRAAHLTNLLLAFSGRQVRQPRIVDLNALILDMTPTLLGVTGDNIELKVVVDRDLCAVEIDPKQFRQVMVNLVTNSAEAISHGESKITIETDSHQTDYVRVSVIDTGNGISDDAKDHIFEPFYTTRPRWEKVGMGLSVCYGILSQNSGRIEFESEFGKGARFDVYLPRSDQEIDEMEDDAGHRPSRIDGETVLVVEEDTGIMDLAVRALREHGYAVLMASNFAEALNLVQDHDSGNADYLLTSVVKPHANARDLDEAVRRVSPETRIVHVIGDDGFGENLFSKRFNPVLMLDKLKRGRAHKHGNKTAFDSID